MLVTDVYSQPNFGHWRYLTTKFWLITLEIRQLLPPFSFLFAWSSANVQELPKQQNNSHNHNNYHNNLNNHNINNMYTNNNKNSNGLWKIELNLYMAILGNFTDNYSMAF